MRPIFTELSFRVEAGRALVLLGPNGSGKTTLLRALADFLPSDAGTIVLGGGEDEHERAEYCHYIGHRDGLKMRLTVKENLQFYADYLGDPGAPANVDTALDSFGLAALGPIPTSYLSAGQKRRLALARLLVAKRPVWLLDEPSVSLDTASLQILTDVIKTHLKTGGIAVVATHLPLGIDDAQTLNLGTMEGAA
jgi:heme exporter protein A